MTLADPATEVLIIDGATVDRAGLEALVRREVDLKVCAETATPEQALTLAVQPTVVILGLVSGGPSDVTPIERLKARFPGARILVLVHVIDLAAVRAAIAAGVDGYLSKAAPRSVLVHAVRAVANGDPYLDPSIGAALVTEQEHEGSLPVVDSLTPAETEVLRQIALGHTNTETADILAKSLRTIETHRAHIQLKLDAHTRAELVRAALVAGLLVPADHERDAR